MIEPTEDWRNTHPAWCDERRCTRGPRRIEHLSFGSVLESSYDGYQLTVQIASVDDLSGYLSGCAELAALDEMGEPLIQLTAQNGEVDGEDAVVRLLPDQAAELSALLVRAIRQESMFRGEPRSHRGDVRGPLAGDEPLRPGRCRLELVPPPTPQP